jgi:hypothetical protein
MNHSAPPNFRRFALTFPPSRVAIGRHETARQYSITSPLYDKNEFRYVRFEVQNLFKRRKFNIGWWKLSHFSSLYKYYYRHARRNTETSDSSPVINTFLKRHRSTASDVITRSPTVRQETPRTWLPLPESLCSTTFQN